MSEIHQIFKPHFGASDKIRYSFGQSGAFGEQIIARGFDPEGLADGRFHPPAGALQFPIYPPGQPAAIFDPVISGEAVEREEIGILQINRAGVFVGHGKIADFGAGDQLHARFEHLRAAKGFAHKRPFYIQRGGGDAARGKAFGAAIDRGRCRGDIVGVVDIAAGKGRQRHHLAKPGEPPQIPLRACKSALGILPIIAQQCEAVGLKLHLASQHPVGELLAKIDRGQRQRDLALLGVDPERLGRPSGNRQEGQIGDPFEIDGRTQPVIAADIVTAQEGAVAGEAHRCGQAPIRRELEPAIAFDVAARFALEALLASEIGQPVAGSGIAGDLIGAFFRQVPPFGADQRGDVGKHRRAQCDIGIGGDAPVILARKLQPVDLRDPHIGHQKARFRSAIGAQGQPRQRQDARAEQFEHRALEINPAARLIVDHPVGGDAPTGIFRAALRIDHRAGGVGGIGQDRGAIIAARGRSCGQPAARAQGDQQFGHGAGVEFLGQFDLIGEQLIASLVHQPDIAGGDDLPAAAIPGDVIGAHGSVFGTQDDIAARSDGFSLVIVSDLARFEFDPAGGAVGGDFDGGRGVLCGERCRERGQPQRQHRARCRSPHREAQARARGLAPTIPKGSRHGLAYCTARA